MKGKLKETATTASVSESTAASSKNEVLSNLRNDVNSLMEENKKITKFCIQLKKRLLMLEEKLNKSED